MRRADFALIAVCLLLSLAPAVIWTGSIGGSCYAEVTVAGSVQRRVQLSAHHGVDEFDVNTEYGFNHIVIEDGAIFITDADCPDKLCVQQGRAEKHGDRIACLPHRLLIEVKGEGDSDVVPLN